MLPTILGLLCCFSSVVVPSSASQWMTIGHWPPFGQCQYYLYTYTSNHQVATVTVWQVERDIWSRTQVSMWQAKDGDRLKFGSKKVENHILMVKYLPLAWTQVYIGNWFKCSVLKAVWVTNLGWWSMLPSVGLCEGFLAFPLLVFNAFALPAVLCCISCRICITKGLA